MANTFPKRWTKLFQMRASPAWLEAVNRIAAARGITCSEAVRAVIEEEDARLARKGRAAAR